MQTCLRVISDSGVDDADDLRQVIHNLVAQIPGTSEYAKMKPHAKGGFSVYLEYRDEDTQLVINLLTESGWMPCF